jgi:hypothetical protein
LVALLEISSFNDEMAEKCDPYRFVRHLIRAISD